MIIIGITRELLIGVDGVVAGQGGWLGKGYFLLWLGWETLIKGYYLDIIFRIRIGLTNLIFTL